MWACAIAVVAVGLAVPPAGAGGSVWKFDAEQYRPGERAFGWAAVAWEHSSTLGRPEDGPYSAYLAPATPDQAWPPISSDVVRVAEVEIHLEPYDAGEVRFGPHHATIEFTVPELPPGRYSVMHCNSPCTTTLGDITFGYLTIHASTSLPTTLPEVPDSTDASDRSTGCASRSSP